jgi:hypothetical protein
MANDIERLRNIMKEFNKAAGIGVFPMKPKDLYFILELLEKLLERDGNKQND